MPLHTLSAELLQMILQHAPERKRVQVLHTLHVSLDANGIITIDASTVFFSATCERQGELKTTNDFHAWMCSEARGTLGFIDGALVRHSTRMI